ncbi:alpha/beta fold hydrolase [Nocardia xishanensis]|uniref:alpha/beta fold hydrolase n=1 Tax=Nocardia xishanensis TaxID=238964 RepID=UPI001FE0F621|nr:alpha/beta hydrolase [Nocardia xishanensis]
MTSPVLDNHSHGTSPAGKRRRRRFVAAAIVGAMVVLLLGNSVLTAHQSAAAMGESTLTVDGRDIHISQDGLAGHPALVLIHGFAASTRWWDQLVPLLTDSYHVIRIDLLGHGSSAKPDGDGYSIPQQGNRVAAVLEQLGIRHAIVIGHSTGGSVATSLAEQRPDLVTALAFIGTGPSLADDTSDSPVTRLLTTPVVGEALWQLRTDGLLRQSSSSAFATDDFPIPQQFVDDLRGMTYHSITATMAAAIDYLNQRTLPDRLTALAKPLLVIFGEQDRRWRYSTSTAAYRTVPGATVVTMPDVGHSPLVEDPARTAEILLSFTGIHIS